MKDEIKIKTIGQLLDYVETEQKAKELIDYITNLQEDLDYQRQSEIEYNEKHTKLMNKYKNLQEENERLKTQLNCKEYFSATMPENTEFVILTKNNYDRQQKDIQLDLIDYKSRIEKANTLLQERYEENKKIFNANYDFKFILDFEEELLQILKGVGKDE